MNIALKNSSKTILLSLTAVLLFCQSEQIIDVTRDDNLDKVIDSEFKRLQMPGLAYVAVKEDSIVYIGAKGYANRKEKKPFTPQTRMMIASTSKTIIGTAVMQLYEKGLISLEEDINRYLPFKVRNPNFPDDVITVKMLLTHTSSISDVDYLYSVFYLHGYVDYPESLMSFERNYLTEEGRYYTKNNFSKDKPGSNSSYSNVGASLLACIVEHVGETDFNAYCKKSIFRPLGMTRTTWFFSETPKEEMAIPYADNNITDPSNPFYSYPDYPDGHLITTVDDLSKLLRAYIMDGTYDHYRLLKPETVDLILQEYAEGDACGDDCKQGLLFQEPKIGNGFVWGHDGGEDGVSTEMFFKKDSNVGYIMFNNRTDAYSETLAEALLLYSSQN